MWTFVESTDYVGIEESVDRRLSVVDRRLCVGESVNQSTALCCNNSVVDRTRRLDDC